NPKSIEQILLAHPFEIDLGYPQTSQQGEDHAKHIVNYPEVAVVQHDCRPNAAFYIDNNLSFRATVARRIAAGEELTISYLDPFLPRAKRREWVKKHRGLGKPCPCEACVQKNSFEQLKKSDARMKELLKLQAKLKDHDSRDITVEMIDRYIKLFEEEKLHIRLGEAYETAAHNYNYLGEDKLAKKYADMAVQAGMIEGGSESNDVIAMKIMASDVKGHYSYQYTLKRLG
ncbi:hypothetical protein B0T17DRAFT_455723, partial [Bombardia bombarda]